MYPARAVSRAKTLFCAVNYLRGATVRNERIHLLVACMPKSGSSYLTVMLGQLPGMRRASIVRAYDRNEQELSELELIRHHQVDYVTQNHVRYSAATCQLIQDFNLKPILLVRNIFDVIVSIRDHIHNISTIWPMAYFTEDMCSWPDDRLYAFIVDMMIPWYFNFYLSWYNVTDKLLIRYEGLIDDPHSTLAGITKFARMDLAPNEIDAAVIATGNQQIKMKNIGLVGRGARLDDSLKDRVKDLAFYYPGVDFTAIGL